MKDNNFSETLLIYFLIISFIFGTVFLFLIFIEESSINTYPLVILLISILIVIIFQNKIEEFAFGDFKMKLKKAGAMKSVYIILQAPAILTFHKLFTSYFKIYSLGTKFLGTCVPYSGFSFKKLIFSYSSR